MKVLMVCLGNICRSPMAEGILRQKISDQNLDVSVDSCGTSSWHAGEQPDHRAMNKMEQKGIDITDLRARQFRRSDFTEFDHILVMDQSNHEDVLALTNSDQEKKKVTLMLEYNNTSGYKNVPDPYYGEEDGFETVFQLLDKACDNFLATIAE